MSTEQRRHDRFRVHLAVSYPTAAEFVEQYIENLSIGGLFVAGARDLTLLQEVDVDIELPGQGRWRVRAKPVYTVDSEAAAKTGRKPGVGMEITLKPPGYDDALLGYLLRLGRRRDVVVMVGDVPGTQQIVDAGYRITPLEGEDSLAAAISSAIVPVVAVVVPLPLFEIYTAIVRAAGAGDIVFALARADDAADLVARIDSLL